MGMDISKPAVISVISLLLIGAIFYTVAGVNTINQQASLANEVETCLAQGYTMYVEGNKVTRQPEIGRYNVSFDDESKSIYFDTKASSAVRHISPVVIPII